MLLESLEINYCLRSGEIARLYEIFPTLSQRDYPNIFKETFPTACLYDMMIAEQMLEHLYKPLNALERSALRATILYSKNMLRQKIERLKPVKQADELAPLQSIQSWLDGLELSLH